ncbi:glycosyltransferase [Aquabacterium soli]|uniref:Glycosyltransferase n=1 Tax=Aquabacterium soli TaxID=2493092 RepID=A0A426UZA0_9BURK|nr:glycosyltransferase family 4 protein [Aquabacterium soli]RRR99936.1 glycosyltransferase [Aquabacterium soli]
MKVAVTGLRGFPNIQGGIETHAQHLYPLLVERGVNVTVFGRSPYLSKKKQSYKGVTIRSLPCPRFSSLETVVHTFLSVLYCGLILRPDLIHIHAVGPGLFTPLARILGLRVVFTHHGEDYHRQKWGRFASRLLQLGEMCGSKHANAVIAISQGIKKLIEEKYQVVPFLIPNGVELKSIPTSCQELEKFGIRPFQYILVVGRLVPEKRQDDLISAFSQLKEDKQWKHIKLVIVGAADHKSDYLQKIEKLAGIVDDVIMTGFRSGKTLSELYRWAGVFCLPSSHEGLPIALLEAMSSGCPVLASNISPNLEVGLKESEYFELGDIESLRNRIEAVLLRGPEKYDSEANRSVVAKSYDWRSIAAETLTAYQRASE